MRLQSRSRNPVIIQPDGSPKPTPATVPAAFLIHVQGPDGKSEASIPIWVPLSIMAASAARAAGQPEPLAQIVNEAVLSHGDLLAQQQRGMSPAAAASANSDVMAHIITASNKAGYALTQGGGSTAAAAQVKEAIRGGGALLVPTLVSHQTIRLDQSESRNDTETRGLHDVGSNLSNVLDGTTSEAPTYRSKQVSWMDGKDGMRGKNGQVYDDNPLLGKDINLGRPRSKQKTKPKPKPKPKPKTRRPSQRQRSRRKSLDDTKSSNSVTLETVTEEDSEFSGGYWGGFLEQNLVDDGDETIGSCTHAGGRGCMIVDAAGDLQDQTFRPINLLPQWEVRSAMTGSLTHATRDTARSTIAPLVNLFLPVPKEERDPNAKANSKFNEKDKKESKDGKNNNKSKDSCTSDEALSIVTEMRDGTSRTTRDGTSVYTTSTRAGTSVYSPSTRGGTSAYTPSTRGGTSVFTSKDGTTVLTLPDGTVFTQETNWDGSTASGGTRNSSKHVGALRDNDMSKASSLGNVNSGVSVGNTKSSRLEDTTIITSKDAGVHGNLEQSGNPTAKNANSFEKNPTHGHGHTINRDPQVERIVPIKSDDGSSTIKVQRVTSTNMASMDKSVFQQSSVVDPDDDTMQYTRAGDASTATTNRFARSYTTDANESTGRTMTTNTVMSMQSNEGGLCYTWRWPKLFEDSIAESTADGTSRGGWHSMSTFISEELTEANVTLPTEANGTLPTSIPVPDPVPGFPVVEEPGNVPPSPHEKKPSAMQKVKTIFGKLNCACTSASAIKNPSKNSSKNFNKNPSNNPGQRNHQKTLDLWGA